MLEAIYNFIDLNFEPIHFLSLVIAVIIMWPLAMIGSYTLTGYVLDKFFD